MPYTNAWNVTDPPGSAFAKHIDDHIRKLRLDIDERMNDIVEDWSADPVKLSDEAINYIPEQIVVYPWTMFGGSNNINWSSNGYFTIAGTQCFCPLLFSPGTKITRVEVFANRLGASTFNWGLFHYPFESGVSIPPVTQIAAYVSATANYTVHSSGDIDFNIVDGRRYVIRVESHSQGVLILGARIRFDPPRLVIP